MSAPRIEALGEPDRACKLKAYDFGLAEGYVKDAGLRDVEEDDTDADA